MIDSAASHCSKKVVNAPVTKSGDVFCSRECRIELKKRRQATQVQIQGAAGAAVGEAKEKAKESPLATADTLSITASENSTRSHQSQQQVPARQSVGAAS